MDIKNVADLVRLSIAAKTTPALVGTSGVGKTSICEQIAKELGFEKVIKLRPSLVADVGDLVGLPDFEVEINNGIETKRTTFNAPDWLPREGEKALIVIDEINRTQKDIIMAMFDLIEADHPKIGNYYLPKDCKVVATLNPPTDNYTVLDIKDSAFTSRLCFIKVVPNLDSFTNWGRESGEVSNVMLDFLNKNAATFFGYGEDFEVDEFFGSDESEQANHFKNNNRSKKKVSDLYTSGKALGISDGIITEAIRGIAGRTAAAAFMDFAENYSDEMTLAAIKKSKKSFKNFDFNRLANIAKILGDLKHELKTGKFNVEKHTGNVAEFLNNVPLDTLKGFFLFATGGTVDEGVDEKYLPSFADKLAENDKLFAKSDEIIMEVEEATTEEDTTEE
jgi:hypothetical protein